MSMNGDRADVRAFVDQVAVEFAAESVLADVELGEPRTRGMRVVAPGEWADVESADLVVSFDAPERERGWEEHLAAVSKRARKVLLVFARNAERFGQRKAPDTAHLAGVLWQLGRVREHAYLGLPRLVGSSRVVHVPAGALVRKTARLHAFVVDMSPRTPQARRRLRVAGPEAPGTDR